MLAFVSSITAPGSQDKYQILKIYTSNSKISMTLMGVSHKNVITSVQTSCHCPWKRCIRAHALQN